MTGYSSFAIIQHYPVTVLCDYRLCEIHSILIKIIIEWHNWKLLRLISSVNYNLN